MVKEITGDLLRDGRGILCHQVNFHGVMGAGVAASIRKILPPKEFDRYHRYCMIHGAGALGKVQWLHLPGVPPILDKRVVANMFSQRDYAAADNSLTDYTAMKKCFQAVHTYAARFKLPVYIPGYIGCGIAGGDWSRVKAIIDDIFKNSSVEAVIVYWEKEAGNRYTADEGEGVPLF